MSYDCCVVIPAYNANSTIGAQLEALASQDFEGAFEVVVADNGPSDGLMQAVEPWTSRLKVRVIDASKRRGPSAARNIGVHATTSERLLFCDADDMVSRQWVRSLLIGLDNHDFVGGPCVPFADRSGIWLPAYESDHLPVAWDSWPYAFAGNFGITADAWQKIGGFDETLTGAEEIEFAWRAREVGFEPTFVPEAILRYRVRPSLRGRLQHEYNSGRGTAMLGRRLRPDLVRQRSWRSQLRHTMLLVSRFPRSLDGRRWAAWTAVLAFDAGTRAGMRQRGPVMG